MDGRQLGPPLVRHGNASAAMAMAMAVLRTPYGLMGPL